VKTAVTNVVVATWRGLGEAFANFGAKLKRAWKSWPVQLGALAAFAAVALTDQSIRVEVQAFLGPDYFPKVVAAVALVNMYLRFKTSKPLDQR